MRTNPRNLLAYQNALLLQSAGIMKLTSRNAAAFHRYAGLAGVTPQVFGDRYFSGKSSDNTSIW
jgi:hypothetical protein